MSQSKDLKKDPNKSLKLFWHRRDLRLKDNAALYQALSDESPGKVQPLFIFDSGILDKLKNSEDKRLPFLHEVISQLKRDLQAQGSDLWVFW